MILLLFYPQQGTYLPVSNTTVIQYPVDCVMAGDQIKRESPRQLLPALLRRIFGE